jgi:hypothetical protein
MSRFQNRDYLESLISYDPDKNRGKRKNLMITEFPTRSLKQKFHRIALVYSLFFY